MADPQTRRTTHRIEVAAPAEAVYGLVADVESWPRVFPPTVHVEHLERDGNQERIRIWATANGEIKTWTSRRRLDPAARRVEFRQEVSQPPVAAMGGAWVIEAIGPGRTRVVLEHDYAAVGDDPDNVAWIEAAIDRNSEAELAALRATAEQEGARDELLLSFDDTLQVAASAKDVYAFLYDARRWEERLPHVARVDLREDVPDLQVLEMDTRTKDGSTHTTRSVRVCFPHTLIAYKQQVVPALMSAHTGYWLLEETDGGVRLTSHHTVVLRRENIPAVLGEAATVADARAYVRTALSGNSTATMRLAQEYAEGRAA
ncbi:aromatase/cyclase [Streptomyces sp. I05A-00742]|uniref:aromatase/cyclase n=1 Tax=Streptomyces sp. I05A-00742 TaxID=2732853 RepID=UPI0014882356|nr:aromatase/cyclase [Streptomyces sp. I05A-00742]